MSFLGGYAEAGYSDDEDDGGVMLGGARSKKAMIKALKKKLKSLTKGRKTKSKSMGRRKMSRKSKSKSRKSMSRKSRSRKSKSKSRKSRSRKSRSRGGVSLGGMMRRHRRRHPMHYGRRGGVMMGGDFLGGALTAEDYANAANRIIDNLIAEIPDAKENTLVDGIIIDSILEDVSLPENSKFVDDLRDELDSYNERGRLTFGRTMKLINNALKDKLASKSLSLPEYGPQLGSTEEVAKAIKLRELAELASELGNPYTPKSTKKEIVKELMNEDEDESESEYERPMKKKKKSTRSHNIGSPANMKKAQLGRKKVAKIKEEIKTRGTALYKKLNRKVKEVMYDEDLSYAKAVSKVASAYYKKTKKSSSKGGYFNEYY